MGVPIIMPIMPCIPSDPYLIASGRGWMVTHESRVPSGTTRNDLTMDVFDQGWTLLLTWTFLNFFFG